MTMVNKVVVEFTKIIVKEEKKKKRSEKEREREREGQLKCTNPTVTLRLLSRWAHVIRIKLQLQKKKKL